jgi:hypothetical protein
LALGFDVKSEIPEAQDRLDLYVKLGNNVYAIVLVRHVPKIDKLTKAEENVLLASFAASKLDDNIISHYIVAAVEAKLGSCKVSKLLEESNEEIKSDAEKQKILLNLEDVVLSEAEWNLTIENLARERFNQNEIEEVLLKAPPKSEPTHAYINNSLKSSAQDALKDIDPRKYKSIIGDDAKVINTLGLFIYGYGTEVYAEFGS